ncbi:MAG: heparan-alpha-glucosaminide N-acetyltransferase domain-containing protein [Nocardioides sp.]
MSTTVRLVGLDVARALALLGMVATHLLPDLTASGEQTWPHELAGGRASALFAVLAGVALALMTGRRTPLQGGDRMRASLGLAARALLIALLGLALATQETGLAVILTYYGVMFLLAIPFAGLRARSLALLAAAWLVVVPLVSHWLRPDLPPRRYDNPLFEQLEQPGLLMWELLFTGYYPAVPWLAYVFAGMAVGRSDLARRSVQAGLLAGGVLLAGFASFVSGKATAGEFRRRTLEDADFGLYGTTSTDRWAWLLVDSPHSATPFDLAATIGSSLAVIGLCLLLAGVLPGLGVRGLAVVFGAGTMTLTLYSLHAVLRTDRFWPPDDGAFTRHVVLLGVIGMGFVLLRWRGPLELAVGLPARLLRRRNRTPAAYVESS